MGSREGTSGLCRGCLAGSVLVAAGGPALVGNDWDEDHHDVEFIDETRR